MAKVRPVSGTASKDVRWYQRAVFYEILVRGFFDSNNDGTGDIPGLDQQAGLHPVVGGRLHLAAPVLRVPAARRRVTTSPTTGRSCPSTARWPTSPSWSTRPTGGA